MYDLGHSLNIRCYIWKFYRHKKLFEKWVREISVTVFESTNLSGMHKINNDSTMMTLTLESYPLTPALSSAATKCPWQPCHNPSPGTHNNSTKSVEQYFPGLKIPRMLTRAGSGAGKKGQLWVRIFAFPSLIAGYYGKIGRLL